jgi:multidrug efflux pump subunit AcrA (membrane-fusion protein)
MACCRPPASASATRRSWRARACTLQRYRTLLSQDSIARQDVDTQAALVKQLEGTVMTDKRGRRHGRLNLGYTQVVAPISGPRRPAHRRHRQPGQAAATPTASP